MKTAICLAVKNEEKELPYWIAWHASIGVDTFFIYDDQSTDNTLNVINSLSSYYDIRVKKVTEDRDDHVIRQIDIYNDCLLAAKTDFDWIAFIDSDEYIYVDSGSIKAFLQSFPEDVHCVALNWCCFGTNGYWDRPEMAPVLAYKKHGKNDLYWNNHTKVIVKPQKVVGKITYVHNIYVEGRTATSDGMDVNWTTVFGGFTSKSPNWKNARLLHYQTRSIEHYTKRYKDMELHRKYNNGDPVNDIINNNDYNSEEFIMEPSIINSFICEMGNLSISQSSHIKNTIEQKTASELKSLSYSITPKYVDEFIPTRIHHDHQISTKCVSIHNDGGILSGELEKINFFRIKTNFGNYLSANQHKNIISEANTNTETIIIGVYINGSKYFHFLSPNDNILLLRNDARISPILTYEVWENENQTVCFSHPRTKKYISVDPYGNIVVDRKRAWEWEWFTLEEIEFEKQEFYYDRLNIDGIDSVYNSIYKNKDVGYLFNSYFSMINEYERKTLDFLLGGIIGEYIF